MPKTDSTSLPPCWRSLLETEFEQPYWQALMAFVSQQRAAHTVFPPQADTLAALMCPIAQIRVVILGQDPYHGPGQAHGHAFSVPRGVPTPPSLKNIFKALAQDLRIPMASHGDLRGWADQGVMLLNTVLTVRAHEANSHRNQGWERFSDAVISGLSAQRAGLVFVLWGAAAAKKSALIDEDKHRVLRAPHPSPLSAYRGFFECGHFSRINTHLEQIGHLPIDWRVGD